MPLPQKPCCTADDYWNLPDGQRAELIDGELYFMAPPDFLHQKLVSEFTQCIGQYIKAHKGTCEVIPAPFAVHLDDGTGWNLISLSSAIKTNWRTAAATAPRTGSLRSYHPPAESTITLRKMHCIRYPASGNTGSWIPKKNGSPSIIMRRM